MYDDPRRAVRPATESWFDQLDALPATPLPADQAQGLRRLFTGATLRCIPVVANAHCAEGGVLLERLCSAYAEMGLTTLLVDAADTARAPQELVPFDLAEGVEPLGPRLGYLAARGLPLRYVDAGGSTAGFLDALAEAVPGIDVLLVHAGASDLARLFARRVQEQQAATLRPLLLCSGAAEALTDSYAAAKLLAQRAGLKAHDLLLSGAPQAPRSAQIARRLAHCLDDFLGAVLHDWVAVDPAEEPDAPVSPALHRLAREQLACALAQHGGDSGWGALAAPPRRSALPPLR